MPTLTGPLADALRRGRASFNAKFAAASTAESPIDAGDFQRHIELTLDPIVRSVNAEFAERTDNVVEALFDLSLVLFRNHLLLQYPIIQQVWIDLLPRIPRLLAREPGRVAGAITNALYNLTRTSGANPQSWLKLCCAGATDFSLCSVTDFLNCGAILAWRCGMPQYRLSALEKASALPPVLAAKALGVEPERIPEVILNLISNPWIAPQDIPRKTPPELKLVAKAGAFRGFAGQFLTPPKVACIAGELVAADADTAWRLHADIHNALLLRCEVPSAGATPSDAVMKPDGTLRWQGLERRFPDLAAATSIAATRDTVAITLPTSHHLFLVALA